jgi:hypothetical protein
MPITHARIMMLGAVAFVDELAFIAVSCLADYGMAVDLAGTTDPMHGSVLTATPEMMILRVRR